MIKYFILLFLSTFSLAASPIKVVVLDTGLDLEDPRFKFHLCKEGHKDFTGEGIKDDVGHGTHVAGIIQETAGKSNYCLIIVKYSGIVEHRVFNDALAYVYKIRPDIVNISGGGEGYTWIEKELFWFSNFIYVVAAGNSGTNLDKKCIYYPACYGFGNIQVVGNLLEDGKTKNSSSNYGSVVQYWEIGTNVESTLPFGRKGKFTGTSMAAPKRTGKLIKELNAKRN